MAEDRIKALLARRVDQLVGEIDVETAWHELVSRAAGEPQLVPSPAPEPRPARTSRWRLVTLEAAAVLVVLGALVAAVALRSTAAHRPTQNAEPTTIVSGTPAFVPEGPVPGSFVAYVEQGSRQLLMSLTTDAKSAKGLAVGSGLLYSRTENGIVVAPGGREVYYLDSVAYSPPGPGIGIYRVSIAGVASSVVAYGADPAISTDGSFLAYLPDTVLVGGGLHRPRTEISSGDRAPFVGLVGLTGSDPADEQGTFGVALDKLFPTDHLAGDVIVGLVWLAGAMDDLAVILQRPSGVSPAGACSLGSSPPSTLQPTAHKCPPPTPPPTDTIAVLGVSESEGVQASVPPDQAGVRDELNPYPLYPEAEALAIEAAPAHFDVSLAVPGQGPSSVMLLGRTVRNGSQSYQVLTLLPLATRPQPREAGELPAACTPLALDARSGAVLCQTFDALDIEQLGKSGPARRVPLPQGLIVGNAAW